MEEESLVSVIVITYNQEKYILETLESVKSQTYRNIELIISDDYSTDKTIEICTSWISLNKDQFKGINIIVPLKNTGTAININRGIKASAGKWLKVVAGDDSLPADSIEEFIKFINEQKCKICCCKLKLFGGDYRLLDENEFTYNRYYEMIDKCWEYQKKMNARQLFVPGPGLFFSRELYNSVGGFNERYPFAEEWPFTTKVINKGNKIFFLDKYLYNYRIYSGSLCRDELGMNKRVFLDMKRYVFDEGIFVLLKNEDILYLLHIIFFYLFLTNRYNNPRKSLLFRCAKLFLLFSPIACIEYIKKYLL